MNKYFYAEAGSSPSTKALSVEELIAAGITPETLVWRKGMPEWVPASTVPEVAQAFPAPAAAPAPVAPPPAPQPAPQPAPVPTPQVATAPQSAPVEPVRAPLLYGPPPRDIPTPAPIPDAVMEAFPGEGRVEGSSGSKLWIWIVLALVVLGGIGAGLFFFLSSSDSTSDEEADKPKTEKKAEVKPVEAKAVSAEDVWKTLSNPQLTFDELKSLQAAGANLPAEADTLVRRLEGYFNIANLLHEGKLDEAYKAQEETKALLPAHENFLNAASRSFVDGEGNVVKYTAAAAEKAKAVFAANFAQYKSFAALNEIASNEEVRKAQEAPAAAPAAPAPARQQARPVQRTTTTPVRTTRTTTSNGMRDDVRRQFDRARRGY